MIFTRLANTKRSASSLALGLALISGVAVGVTALETPAFAQKKKEKKASGAYSKEFVAVYKPIEEQANAPGADPAALKARVPELVAIAQSEDERMAVGGMIYSIGQKAGDPAVQLQGIGMMLESGKVAAENVGAYNMQAGQTAYQLKEYAKARTFLEAAIAAGYTQNDPEAFIAETYIGENRPAEGLAYLARTIEAKKAAGQPVPEAWIKRGLATAYNSKLTAEAGKFSMLYVREYPSETSWGDAVAILLNTGGYQNPEILDLMRLARRTNTLRDGNMYGEYAEAADYRRLPGEVVAVIDEGLNSGKLKRTDQYVADTRNQAASRVAADKADMAGLKKSARAPGAQLRSVLAAGDTLLSYGEGAEAEEFYAKALTMAGADTGLVLTRLGIAQFDQGKFAEAEATFGKVQGTRQPIAGLWAAYAAQKAKGG